MKCTFFGGQSAELVQLGDGLVTQLLQRQCDVSVVFRSRGLSGGVHECPRDITQSRTLLGCRISGSFELRMEGSEGLGSNLLWKFRCYSCFCPHQLKPSFEFKSD